MLNRTDCIEKLKSSQPYLDEKYGVKTMRDYLPPVFKNQINKYGIRVF